MEERRLINVIYPALEKLCPIPTPQGSLIQVVVVHSIVDPLCLYLD